jgi:hypothetical protein
MAKLSLFPNPTTDNQHQLENGFFMSVPAMVKRITHNPTLVSSKRAMPITSTGLRSTYRRMGAISHEQD